MSLFSPLLVNPITAPFALPFWAARNASTLRRAADVGVDTVALAADVFIAQTPALDAGLSLFTETGRARIANDYRIVKDEYFPPVNMALIAAAVVAVVATPIIIKKVL